jgi:hypothetical protein
LPEGVRRLSGHVTYPVRPSEALRARQEKAAAGARARKPETRGPAAAD